MKVTNMQGNADDNATGRTSPFTIQFPCPAGTNLLVGIWIGVTGDLNSVSDSINGAWTSADAGVSNGASGTVHIYYKAGATGGTNMTVTLTTAAATSAGDTFDIFAVVGAATSPFDVFASTTGNQATVAQYNIVSITPTTANGVVFAAVGVASGNTGPDTWTPGFWAPPDENNAWGMFYNPNTSAVQFKVTPTNPPNVAAGLWTSQAAAFKAPVSGVIFESLPDDGEQFRGADPTPRMMAMDDWLPLAPRPPLFEWDESQRWQLCREARWSQATAEIDTGLLPIIPKIVYDDDPSRSFEIRSKQDDEPWHTFFLIPVPPPTRGWDDWDWSRDFSIAYAKPPEAEPFDFSAPITPAFGWFEDSPVFSGNAGSLAGMVVLDEFVNAPAAPVFGPAPRGRSVRFGFSISSFR